MTPSCLLKHCEAEDSRAPSQWFLQCCWSLLYRNWLFFSSSSPSSLVPVAQRFHIISAGLLLTKADSVAPGDNHKLHYFQSFTSQLAQKGLLIFAHSKDFSVQTSKHFRNHPPPPPQTWPGLSQQESTHSDTNIWIYFFCCGKTHDQNQLEGEGVNLAWMSM